MDWNRSERGESPLYRIAALLLLAACTATVKGGPGEPGSGGIGASGAAGGSSVIPGTGAAGGTNVVDCSTRDPGPAVVRRLTRLEYANTLRDLLGSAAGIADGFPIEERQLGFDNNASALNSSPVLVEQYMLAAEKAAADAVSANLATLAPCPGGAAAADACGQQFISTFVPRAFRGPLAPDEVTRLTGVFNAGKATDFKTGIRLVLTTVLQSPRFLYRVEFGVAPAPVGATVVKLTDGEMASRLSYLLWHTQPDDGLIAAASAGKLSVPADVDAQVDRMLRDPRARGMVADFHDQWLRLAEISAVEKDPAVYPAFSPAIAGWMRQEATQFLDFATWDGGGDLAALFTTPATFVNGPLAQYYGLPGVSGNAFVKVPLDGVQRGGFLTGGGLLSLLAKANQTSPVHRGKFVREQLLCTDLPPPPANLMVKAPDLSTTLTTRQRFTQHATDVACSGCHRLMDPIGLGFEGFDGAGRFRSTENGQLVDTSGEVLDSDVPGVFKGVVALEGALAGSNQVRACVARKWFRYGHGRGETSADACSLAAIQQKFAASGYKVRALVVALTQSDAFLYRRVTSPAGGAP